MVDRKSTRLNSSHTIISYAVFCLKKKYTRILAARHGGLGRPGGPAPRLFGARAAGGGRPSAGGGGARGGGSMSRRSFFFLRLGRPPNSPLFPTRPLSR